ncbi:MAG: DUF2142 domain-containing protein [Bacteroidetes bacterium]|nr:DUF2142 domain-containing protein [Bacteroidota bacterium]
MNWITRCIGNRKKNQWLILSFCAFAAVRVFIYSASFPFFGNVDEQAHFDLVMKYSQYHVPGSFERISPQSAYYIPRYESPEFFNKPSDFPGKQFPVPKWKLPEVKVRSYYDEGVAFWSRNYINHESSQAPLYYAIAGMWTNLGTRLGLTGGWVLYWIRFLNILFAAALVLVAYVAANTLFPENRFVVLSVPLLTAFFPQDSYYSIQNDVLSPLLFGIAFIGMTRFIRGGLQDKSTGTLTGLALAATLLVKAVNLPLLMVGVLFLLFHVRKIHKEKKRTVVPLLLFSASLMVPVILWFTWNLTAYGDLTASEGKIQILGWTHQSFLNWFSHPLFTFHGLWIFLSETIITFWRGELIWRGVPLSLPAADYFYSISSLIFVALAMISFRKEKNYFQWQINQFAFWSFVSLLVSMAVLSVSFDFGNCENPSRAHPYFTSGRLITAAMVPFLILYVQGLSFAIKGIKNAFVKYGVILLVIFFLVISEIVIHWPVFASPYNFFHLLADMK